MSDDNKLDGISNYGVSKIKSRTIYRKEKLWNIVCVDSTLPRIVVVLSQPRVITSGIEQSHREKWEKTIGILIMSVKDNIMSTIQDIDDLAIAWRTLKSLRTTELGKKTDAEPKIVLLGDGLRGISQ